MIPAFFFYAALSILFLGLALPQWTTYIVGGAQDTRLFLWNLWWFKTALAQNANPFHTDVLFHPYGVSLLSHDYPLWNNLWGWLFQKLNFGIPLATNLTFAVTWTLNGFCSFLLAREVLKRSQGPLWAAGVAGVYVMTHSYTQARMVQNWGQFNLFCIPLFLFALARLRRTKTLPDAVLAGAALAFNAACHYYFLIYSAAIWGGWVLMNAFPITCAPQKGHRPRMRLIGFILFILGGVAAAWILLTHPGPVTLFGQSVSLTTPVNALLVMWAGLAALAFSYVPFRHVRQPPRFGFDDWVQQGVLALSAAFFLLPLLVATLETILHGDYPKQHILWKTHLSGANLFALFSPNALHAVWGEPLSRWLAARDIHPQEQAAAIGWVALTVIFLSRLWRSDARARRWLFLAVSSTVLAMGTYLHIGSLNTWMPLPFYVWRLLPVMGNVRVPERWMAVGSVAWGVVLALGLTVLAKRYPRFGRWIAAGVFLFVLAENWPGVRAVPPPPREAVYDTLRAQGPGAVLTLPFYVGDSSIGAGNTQAARLAFPWDHLWAQTFYEKPVLGGYIGRIPRRLIKNYKEDPLINRLITLEEKNPPYSPPPTPQQVCQSISRLGITYVLVYPQATPGEAWQDLQKSLSLIPLHTQQDIALYKVNNVTCLKWADK